MDNHTALAEAIEFLRSVKAEQPEANKADLQAAFARRFRPTRARSVFVGVGYALRFSEARTGSFSNTVLSLSALREYDARPFVVVVVRKRSVGFLLANSTFLKKISHSSLMLRVNNIKGSFNGTDIMTEYEGTSNAPANFDQLFAIHREFTWQDNLERLVEATTAIVGRDSRFSPTPEQKSILLGAPARASEALNSRVFAATEAEFQDLIEQQKERLLSAAQLDNVNLRGNTIEQLLTGGANSHDLGDVVRRLGDGPLLIDIKTKLLDRASAPKAYNIDKMLHFNSQPGSVLTFLMIGIDIGRRRVSARLLPVLETGLLDATTVQHHWAGRSSRGVTQLTGRLEHLTSADYQAAVDIPKATRFLERLLSS